MHDQGVEVVGVVVALPVARADQRRVHHDQSVAGLWVIDRELQGDDPTPVVPDDGRAAFAQRADQAAHVLGQRLDVVAAAGLLGEVVAAQVRGDDAVAGLGQRPDLVPPGVPVLGEAVQQQHQRSLALLDVVQADAVGHGVAGLPAVATVHRGPRIVRLIAATRRG